MVTFEEYLELRSTPIEGLNFSTRIYNTMRRYVSRFYWVYNSRNLEDLSEEYKQYFNPLKVGPLIDMLKSAKSSASFIGVKSFGPKSIVEVYLKLAKALKLYDLIPEDLLLAKPTEETNEQIRKIIKDNLKELEEKSNFYDYLELSNLYKALIKNGLSALEPIKAIFFEEGSQSMASIAESVEKYLNYLTVEKVKNATETDQKAVESEIDKLMEEYKLIVDKKRNETRNAGFISRMSIKIGEIKNYHHKPKKEIDNHYHNYNPYTSEDLNLK